MSWLDGLTPAQKGKAYEEWQQGRIESGYERSDLNILGWEIMEREIEKLLDEEKK
jgi:hypothetical protein